MHDLADWTPRRAGDFVLFALAFVGFVVAVGGVIVSSAFLALSGGAISMLAVLCFLPRASSEP